MIMTALWTLLLFSFLGFYRVISGPTIPDRIVGAGTVAILLILIIVLIGLFYGNSLFLDVALAMSVLLFADVLIMAKYFEHGELHK